MCLQMHQYTSSFRLNHFSYTSLDLLHVLCPNFLMLRFCLYTIRTSDRIMPQNALHCCITPYTAILILHNVSSYDPKIPDSIPYFSFCIFSFLFSLFCK